MSGRQEVTFTLDLGGRKSESTLERNDDCTDCIPRIARLMALAIRLEGLIRAGSLRDYADVAQRGQVTRARMTQIMKLLNLAPDIQEAILFLPPLARLNERKLRPIAKQLDWHEQRRMFQIVAGSVRHELA